MTTTDSCGMIMFTEDATRCVEGLRIARRLILLVVLGLGLLNLFA